MADDSGGGKSSPKFPPIHGPGCGSAGICPCAASGGLNVSALRRRESAGFRGSRSKQAIGYTKSGTCESMLHCTRFPGFSCRIRRGVPEPAGIGNPGAPFADRPESRIPARDIRSRRFARVRHDRVTGDQHDQSKGRHDHRRGVRRERRLRGARRRPRTPGPRHPLPAVEARLLHLRPRIRVHSELLEHHHLHRRTGGRAALPRLPHRAARRAQQLPRDLLPPAVRRAARKGAMERVQRRHPAPHDGPRGDPAVHRRLPARRAPGGDARRHRGRALDLLSRHPRHQRPGAPGACRDSHDREAPVHRRRLLQVQHRPALHVSHQLARVRGELPPDDVRGARRAVPPEPGRGGAPWS